MGIATLIFAAVTTVTTNANGTITYPAPYRDADHPECKAVSFTVKAGIRTKKRAPGKKVKYIHERLAERRRKREEAALTNQTTTVQKEAANATQSTRE